VETVREVEAERDDDHDDEQDVIHYRTSPVRLGRPLGPASK
jgi:hypothetical protein